MSKEKGSKTMMGTGSVKSNRKNSSWAKLGIRVISSEAKVGLARRLEIALTKGARVGEHLLVGFKSIMKKLESTYSKNALISSVESSSLSSSSSTSSPASSSVSSAAATTSEVANARKRGYKVSVICVCRESPLLIQNTIVDAAALQSIPTVIVPSFTEQLPAILKLKRANCFALLSSANDDVNTGTAGSGIKKGGKKTGLAESHPHGAASVSDQDLTASDMVQVTLDDLQEHLLQLATKS